MAPEECTQFTGSLTSRLGVRLWTLLALLLAAFGAGSCPCAAHPASIAAATAKVQPDGRFAVEARFDLLAFVLDDTPQRIGEGPMNALLDGPAPDLQTQLAAAESRFRRDFQASGGSGPGVVDSVAFPTLADVQKWRDSGIKPRLPVTMTVTVQGHLPPGAASISFRFPDVLGMIVVTTEFPYREPVSEPVEAGAFSTPLPLTAALPAPVPAATPAPVPGVAQAIPATKQVTTPKPKRMAAAAPILKPNPKDVPAPVPLPDPRPAPPPVEPAPALNPAPSASAMKRPSAPARKPARVAQSVPVRPTGAAPPMPLVALPATHRLPWIVLVFRYVQMGYRHILPEGLDHILFVLGLFLLSTRLKPLVWQITAFTVAHSLTLALSLYGLVRLPSAIIEPVIAASIAFVAIENLFTTELKPWRPFVVFGFGLVHGMGFAGALKDLGLQRHDFLTALVGFNAGVELGQLSVVVLALLAVGWFRSRPGYRRLVVVRPRS